MKLIKELPKLTKPHKSFSRWGEKDKTRAVAIYKSTGSITQTVDLSGIPYETLHYWMKQPWWGDKLAQAQAEDTAQLADASTTIAKMGGEIVKERLQNGDFVLNRDGELIRKPVSAKDAAIITAVAIDKRKTLQEEPLRGEQLGTTERLLKLVEQFARFANAKEVKALVKKSDKLEIKDAEFNEETSEDHGSSGPQSEICEGSGDSGQSSEGIQSS